VKPVRAHMIVAVMMPPIHPGHTWTHSSIRGGLFGSLLDVSQEPMTSIDGVFSLWSTLMASVETSLSDRPSLNSWGGYTCRISVAAAPVSSKCCLFYADRACGVSKTREINVLRRRDECTSPWKPVLLSAVPVFFYVYWCFARRRSTIPSLSRTFPLQHRPRCFKHPSLANANVTWCVDYAGRFHLRLLLNLPGANPWQSTNDNTSSTQWRMRGRLRQNAVHPCRPDPRFLLALPASYSGTYTPDKGTLRWSKHDERDACTSCIRNCSQLRGVDRGSVENFSGNRGVAAT